MNRRGQTLLEAVIATFLLLCCFLVVINLFQAGLGYNVRIENQQVAAMLAERQLEEMRSWSESATGAIYNYENLTTVYDNQVSTPGDVNGFTINTRIMDQVIYSNCSVFERGVAAAGGEVRQLTRSAKNVQVTVNWGGAHNLSVSTLFSQPPRAFRVANAVAVNIQGAPALPLAQDSSMNFQAVGYDDNSNAIPDLFFQWDVVPVDGNGTLNESRNGSLATLINAVNVSGTTYHTGGSLYVHATARYHGQIYSGNSTLISLQ